MDERELKTLAEAVQRGEDAALRTLVEGLSRTLMAMAYRYTDDWEWARDLTQETWVRVHGNIARYDSSPALSERGPCPGITFVFSLIIGRTLSTAAIIPSIEPPAERSMKGYTLLKKMSPMWMTLDFRK